MATSSPLRIACLGVLWLLSANCRAEPREIASPAECQRAERQPPIAAVKAAQEQNPADLKGYFKLADAWSDAGCFREALHVLQGAQAANLASPELTTRLRVARSVLGEEQYFATLERADTEVQVRRAIFRCTSLLDVEACNQAVTSRPNDPDLLAAQRAARTRADRTETAMESNVQAGAGAAVSRLPEGGVTAPAAPPPAPVIARVPPHARVRYTNAAAGDQSH